MSTKFWEHQKPNPNCISMVFWVFFPVKIHLLRYFVSREKIKKVARWLPSNLDCALPVRIRRLQHYWWVCKKTFRVIFLLCCGFRFWKTKFRIFWKIQKWTKKINATKTFQIEILNYPENFVVMLQRFRGLFAWSLIFSLSHKDCTIPDPLGLRGTKLFFCKSLGQKTTRQTTFQAT